MNMGTGIGALAVLALAGASQGAILWDQSDIDTDQVTSRSFLDGTVSSFFGTFSSYVVSDVNISSQSLVQSVTTYFSSFNFPPPTQAVLNIFPKTGNLPDNANDPRPSPGGSGMFVSVTTDFYVDDFQGVMAVTASGINMVLAPGEYWIGLSPILGGGFFGPDLHWATTAATQYGVPSADRYFDAMGPTDWGRTQPEVVTRDASITVRGIVPAPGSIGVLALAGLAAARRRR